MTQQETPLVGSSVMPNQRDKATQQLKTGRRLRSSSLPTGAKESELNFLDEDLDLSSALETIKESDPVSKALFKKALYTIMQVSSKRSAAMSLIYRRQTMPICNVMTLT